jgi:major membrane immunogen (membrane-anchored lipoprotein)
MHHRRNFDDKVFSDTILLELPDGELTAITIDEYTVLRRA